MAKNRDTLISRLTLLLYLQIAGLICSLLTYIPLGSTLLQWLQRICNAGSIVCLFMVAFAGRRYLTAAIFGSAQFALALCQDGIALWSRMMLLQGVLSVEEMLKHNNFGAALNLIAGIAGTIYIYQLYRAHAELVKELDASLSRKWKRLFGWELLAGILISVASMIFATIYVGMGGNMPLLSSAFYTLIYIPSHIVTLISILYLKRTIRLLQSSEESQ